MKCYQYQANVGLYQNGEPSWAKIVKVTNPDGSWVGYQYNSQTGWLTQTITPFESSSWNPPEAPGDSTDTSGDDVTEYGYRASDSGNGQAADSSLLVQPPDTVSTDVLGTQTGELFNNYNGLTVTTRQMLNDGLLPAFESPWQAAGQLSTTTISAYDAASTNSISGNLSEQKTPQGDGGVSYTTTSSWLGNALSYTSDTYNAFGVLASESAQAVGEASTTYTATQSDPFGRTTNASLSGGLSETFAYYSNEWFGPTKVYQVDGSETDYTYTPLGQIATEIDYSGGQYAIRTSYVYDAAGNVVSTSQVGLDSGGNQVGTPLVTNYAYNALGEQTSETDNAGGTDATANRTTSTVYTNNGTYNIATTTNPDNSTSIETDYLDGSVASIGGTAQVATSYSYGVVSNGGDPSDANVTPGSTYASSSTDGGQNWTTSYTNMLGQSYLSVQSAPSGSAQASAGQAASVDALTTFDGNGRPTETVNFDGSKDESVYDPFSGQLGASWTSMDGSSTFDSSDSKTLYSASYDSSSSTLLSASGNVSNTINYSNGGLTVTQTLNGLTSSSTTTMDGGGKYHVTSANPDGTSEIDSYVSGLLVQSQQMGTNNTQTSSTSYDYNPNETLKDSQTTINGILQTTNYTEFQDGTQASVQLPGQAQPQTVTAINSSTEDPTSVTNPNNSTSSQSENTLGQTTQQSGAGLIASEFGYNADGQLTTLITFPSGSVGSDYENAETTTWGYDPATGLMSSKTYNDGTSDQYKYNAAGQLKTVIEPGMSESVGYDSAGQQTSYTAIDSQTGLVSSQVMAEDDQGRPIVTTSVDDGQIATETNSYTALGQPQTESFGAAGNVTVAHSYYPTAPGQNDPNPQNESPDALASMTIQNLPNGQANAQTTYGYDPTSKRLQTITVNGVTFTIAYVSGSTSQIGSITTSVAGQAGSAVTTTLTPYSGANGNASMLGGISVTASGSTLYNATLGYNTNGQIATDSITSTNTSGASQTNDYAYTYGSGPNDNGEDANSLTEVTDNGNTTETYSYDGVGNFTDSSLGAVNALNQYAALSYNLRGDVTNDGTYAYMYDANDRMISVTPDDPDATGAQKLTYGYDSQGRRIWKNVYTWDDANDSWDFDYSRSYVYDGTQLVGELNTTGQLVTGYTWSPSGQLLAVTDYTQATPKTYVAVIDASGNTAMLVDPTNGTVAASYTYDSYGNLLSATGPAQAICSILGKGLYYDIEARSIGHALDRDIRNNIWYERDPAGEVAGGANLYQYLGGDPIDLSDTNGTAALPTQEENNARSPLIAQAKLYMELIYGKNASDLLLAYENSGNIITTASSKGFFWDSKQSNLTNYLHATSQDTITLLSSISPAEAATELYARLTEAAGHGYNGMRDEMLFHLTVVRNSINPDLVLQSYQTGIQQGAQMASTLGSLYYGGFSIAGGEGANLVLSLDDARQGHWLGAMLTLLPVVAPLLAKTGGKLLIQGSRYGELDNAVVQKLIKIGCFARGTLVATEVGLRPIEEIEGQERVWAFEPATGIWRLMPVLVPLQVDFEGEFIKLQVGEAAIEVTAAHPFWVVAGEGLEDRPAPDNIPQAELDLDGSGRWVQAIHLRVGDVLQSRGNGTIPISALSREFREQRVYNLWVDEIHTYAVSREEVVVHNNDCAEELVRLTVNGEAAENAGVQFGNDANQVSHAFRHVEAAGLDSAAVESAVRTDLQTAASKIVPGQPFNQTIQVGGQNITYTAFKLPNGVINVGRITVP